jgi:DivIVA domain-containing protein
MKRNHSPLFELLAQAEHRRADVRHARADVTHAREDGDTAITPDDIRARRFDRQLLWGLKPDDVTAFLDEVADTIDVAQQMNSEMGAQVKLLEEQVQTLTSNLASFLCPAALEPNWNHEASPQSSLLRSIEMPAALISFASLNCHAPPASSSV